MDAESNQDWLAYSPSLVDLKLPASPESRFVVRVQDVKRPERVQTHPGHLFCNLAGYRSTLRKKFFNKRISLQIDRQAAGFSRGARYVFDLPFHL
jgi:hypothetical protein